MINDQATFFFFVEAEKKFFVQAEKKFSVHFSHPHTKEKSSLAKCIVQNYIKLVFKNDT